MRERIKTILLVILLVLGVYLTQKVWIQFSDLIPGFFKEDKLEEVIHEVNLLEGIIQPEKYLINFGQGEFTLIYDDSDYGLWEEAKKSIKYVFSSKDIASSQITNVEYELYKKHKFIEFKLTEPMNSHILLTSLNITDLNEVVNEMKNIDKIFISLDFNGFFIFTSGDNQILIEDDKLSITQLKSIVDSMEKDKNYIKYEPIESVSSDIYIPTSMNLNLPELNLSNYIHSLDEEGKNQLAERFFTREIDYIREIVESNGSTIYEYNNNVLKLNSSGVIEYFHILEDSYSEPNLYISLSTALDFLINRIRVSNEIFLSSVEAIQSDNSHGYRLYFRYKTNKIPLLVGDGLKDYIQIDMFNNQVKTYRHLTNEGVIVNRRNHLTRKIISPKKIIDNNYGFFEKNAINYIDLSFFDSVTLNEKPKLVWVIETKDVLYAFDAYTGSLLYER